jgi:tetratricopeptide (TPR) repeat protein
LKKIKYVLIWATRKERICQLHYYIPVMKFKYLLLAPVAMVAAGCAQLSPKQTVQPAAAPPVAVPQRVERSPVLPKVDLTGAILFQFLVSEIAGQRGDTGLATEGMLDLAKTTRDPRLAKRAAEMALQARREPQALEAAMLWNQIDPDETQARQAVAAILLNSGQLREAKPYLEKLLAGEGDNVGAALLHLNQMLSRQRDKPATLALVQELAAPYLDRAEAHFAIAFAAWGAGKDELALSEVREARRLRSDWEAAALFQGQLLQRTSVPAALDFYRTLLGDSPQMQDARLAYARLLVSERQYVEARTQFEKILGSLPGNPEVSVAVGLLAMQLKDYDAAEKYLQQALAGKYRDEATVRMYLGQLCDERGRYGEAATWYGSVAQGEQYVPAQIRHAAMLAKQGKLSEARKHLGQVAVLNNQQRVQVVVAEAQLLRDAKAYGEAFELLDKALEKLPNYPDLLYDHAMAAEKLGKVDILERDLRKLIQIKPDYAHAYNALGYTLADRSERLDEARQLIEKALQLSPDDFFVMDSLGWVQYRMGQLEKAEDTLRRAYTGQRDPEIAAHLGEVLWARGKHEEAEKIWRAALKENPGHEVLLNVIKKFIPAK